jgi:Na+/melibiose symporter-like transporter
VSKLGGALGLALVGAVLSLIGFEAGAPQQSEVTLDWIRVLFSYFRAAGYFVAFLLLLAYPLSQVRVAATRAALDRRAQSQR